MAALYQVQVAPLLPLAQKKTGNKSERISIQICFVCLRSTRSVRSKVGGRAADSLKEKLASSLQWKKLGWGNFEMRGRQTKWTGDGRSVGRRARASSITGG